MKTTSVKTRKTQIKDRPKNKEILKFSKSKIHLMEKYPTKSSSKVNLEHQTQENKTKIQNQCQS